MPTDLPNEHRLREPGLMELDPSGDGIATDETPRLIASNKVEGTALFTAAGEALGSILTIMVDKYTGQVAYVVMVSGGFLGLGESHIPLPWRALRYDPTLDGYVVEIDAARMAEAPRHGSDAQPWGSADDRRRVDDFYR